STFCPSLMFDFNTLPANGGATSAYAVGIALSVPAVVNSMSKSSSATVLKANCDFKLPLSVKTIVTPLIVYTTVDSSLLALELLQEYSSPVDTSINHKKLLAFLALAICVFILVIIYPIYRLKSLLYYVPRDGLQR